MTPEPGPAVPTASPESLARQSAIYPYYWVLFAVIFLETFAVFNNGAFFLPEMTLLVVGSWALLAGAVSVNRRDLGMLLTGVAALPTYLLFAFWVWTGVSVFWAYSPDLAWIEFNRTGGYLAILMLGILVGSKRETRRLALPLFLAVAVGGVAYGIGVKVAPEIVVNTDALARVAVPMGYTNAMGLLATLGVPFALYMVSSSETHWFLRLAAAASLPLLLIGLFFTVSRGALLALCVGLAVLFAVAPMRLRMSGALMTALAPSVLVAWWADGQEALMQDKMELALRQEAAGPLLYYMLLALAASMLVTGLALFLARYISFSRVVTRAVGAVLILAICITATAGSYSYLSSKPSVREWAGDAYDEFTTGKTNKLGASRLLQVGSQGRFRLWQEAMDNWDDHRWLGTGAQSFPLVHLQRQAFDSPFVKQPHGLPFRILSELGAVGFVIGYAAIVCLSTFMVLALCRARGRWDRALAAAIVAFGVIYLTHSGYDWDWNMFALTAAYFFFAGIAIGWYTDQRKNGC